MDGRGEILKRHRIFNGISHKDIVKRVVDGMDHREFAFYFQPILSVENQGIAAIEAFVHWEHPEVGTLSASDFIDVIEGTQLIVPFGYHCLKVLSESIRKIKDGVACATKFSVNVSMNQLVDSEFTSYLERVLAMHNNSFHDIIIELKEGNTIDDLNCLESVIYDLKHRGIQFALDDFGTGYSTLQYLNQLPVSMLKIDKRYIPSYDKNYDHKVGSIFESIVQLCKCIDVKTVAHSIDTSSQEALVKDLGVDMMQGNYFYNTMSCKSLIQVLDNLKL